MSVMIDVCLGTKGREDCFKQSMEALIACDGAEMFHVWIMDANEHDKVHAIMRQLNPPFIWNVVKEKEWYAEHKIPEDKRGRWSVIYNGLFKMGNAPYLTWWSDDLIPDRHCFTIALAEFGELYGEKPVRDEHGDLLNLGAVSFAWSDGVGAPYQQYGTSLYGRTMINFGLISRAALKKCGWLDENFKFYHADQDASLALYFNSYDVMETRFCHLVHMSVPKSQNAFRANSDEDDRRMREKWAYDRTEQGDVLVKNKVRPIRKGQKKAR